MSVRLTKIIATLGPATGSKSCIKKLVRSGVNVFRLNLSHGTHEVLAQWIQWIREVEAELEIFIGVLLDLQGPKIRVGKFRDGPVQLRKGRKVVFTTRKVLGDEALVPIQYQRFPTEVNSGSLVFLDDGKICVEVEKVSDGKVFGRVREGGPLSDFKGVNLPDSSLSINPLTSKDRKDLAFGLEQEVDFVALSFVGSARDIQKLRRLIHSQNRTTEIIAKIERKQAVNNLEEIVNSTDAVMVARGDLGVEIPLSDVPVVQQRILNTCIQQAKPVIIATQMMESMIKNPRPTRAEVSDIAQSVMSRADAVMLSAETAVGNYPEEAVKVIVETALKTESYLKETHAILPWRKTLGENSEINLGITYSANQLAELMSAEALIVFTLSGGTAMMVAAPRPMTPILAFTSDVSRARRLSLLRGAIPFLIKETRDFLHDINHLYSVLKKKKLVKKKDRVVFVSGIPPGIPHWTNMIRIEEVP